MYLSLSNEFSIKIKANASRLVRSIIIKTKNDNIKILLLFPNLAPPFFLTIITINTVTLKSQLHSHVMLK